MPLVLRLTKGSPLTYAELDGNFKYLEDLIKSTNNMSLSSGYIKFANGWTVQWGSGVTSSGRGDTIYFPTSFGSRCTSVIICEMNAAGWDSSHYSNSCAPTIYGAHNATTRSFKLYGTRIFGGGSSNAYQGGLGYSYMAVGY